MNLTRTAIARVLLAAVLGGVAVTAKAQNIDLNRLFSYRP